MSNQDERLQQVADYIEANNQAEAERTPQELASLQRMANETLSLPPPIDSSSIEAIKSFQASYAGTQALLEKARVTSSLLDESYGRSLSQIREFADKAMAPATAAMRAMEGLYPSKQIEAITRLTSGPLFQPFGGISGLQFPSFESAATQAMERISGQIRALDGLKSFRSIWAENEASQARLASFAQMHSFTEGLAKLHATPKYSEMMKQVAMLAESPLFEALERTSASKLAKQYAVLEVVDSSDKTWLEVIYKHEGIEIQGWVSRSMVKTIQ